MAGGSSGGILQRPNVAHAPDSAPTRSPKAASNAYAVSGGDPTSETDLYLQRSHALVAQLRRAIQARATAP